MAADPDARVDARMDRMEALIRDIESRQHTLQAGQRSFLWAVGLIGAFVAAVVGGLVTLDLSRIFTLGDRLASVETQTGQITAAIPFLREDIAEIKTDVKAVRSDLERIAVAVGAELDQKKAELTRNRVIDLAASR
jgi:hypothetical protein